MKKFMLKRMGVAHDAGSVKPSLHDCIEAVLEQSDSLIDDVLTGLRLSLLPAAGKTLHALQGPAGKATIERVCSSSDAIKQQFSQSLRLAVYKGEAERESARPLVRFDDFQFLEEEQIDANIEFAMTQQEVVMAVERANLQRGEIHDQRASAVQCETQDGRGRHRRGGSWRRGVG